MSRHEPRGQRSITLLPPCRMCGGDRWMRLVSVGCASTSIADVPCPVCNRHPDLPAVHVTAEPPKDETR